MDLENNELICTLAGKGLFFIRSRKLDNLNLVTGEYIFISISVSDVELQNHISALRDCSRLPFCCE